jgi:hypothetical protein
LLIAILKVTNSLESTPKSDRQFIHAGSAGETRCYQWLARKKSEESAYRR